MAGGGAYLAHPGARPQSVGGKPSASGQGHGHLPRATQTDRSLVENGGRRCGLARPRDQPQIGDHAEAHER